MSEQIRQIVMRVWTEHIGIPQEWSPEQTEDFVETEAARLSELIGQAQIEAQHSTIREWRAAHSGAEPDYLTQVGLINTARARAEEIVLSRELYDLVPEEDLSAQEQAAQEEWEAQLAEEATYFQLPLGQDPVSVQRRSDPDRWRGVWRSEPTEAVEDAVRRVWPESGAAFRVHMGLLWQSRIEDGKPVPATTPLPATQLRARRASRDAQQEMEHLVLDEIRQVRTKRA